MVWGIWDILFVLLIAVTMFFTALDFRKAGIENENKRKESSRLYKNL